MKINTDKATTWLGLFAGLATAAAQSGALDSHTSSIVNAVAGLGIAGLGYYTNKVKPKNTNVSVETPVVVNQSSPGVDSEALTQLVRQTIADQLRKGGLSDR